MAPKTMRAAYLLWQDLASRQLLAQKELNHQYLALLHKAESLKIAHRFGLLHTAATWLDQPLDSQTLQIQQRLKNAFTLLGQGFFRRAPTSVQLDIMRYAHRIKNICQRFDHLSARLSFTRKLFNALPPKSGHSQSHRLTLSHPEAVWISQLLRQRRRLTRQTIDLALNRSLQAKLRICQTWLQLLQPSLSPKNLRDFQQTLKGIEDQIAGPPGENPAESIAAHRRLDILLHYANQQAAASMSPSPKTN